MSPLFDPPVLTVLAYSALSAAAAALGAVPLAAFGRGARRALPMAWIGWANALAAGMMVGAAYLLAETGLEGPALPAALGAALGALVIFAAHSALRAAGARRIPAGAAAAQAVAAREAGRFEPAAAPAPRAPGDERPARDDPATPARAVALSALHSACEGVAIGVAMAVDLPFGIFLALAIAVHNVPEATVLCALLAGRGRRLPAAAALAVAADAAQVVLAVAAFALVTAAPAALPWVRGFAVGALVNLVLTEMLPESYREAGHTSIAVVASVAMGIVVLLEGFAP
jgi:zinc transporter ZupT